MSAERTVSIRAIISTVLVGAAIWAGAVGLSSFLAGASLNREVERKGNAPVAELSPEIKQLEQDLAADPKNIELRLLFAERLTEAGAEAGNPQLLMRAVESYRRVLESEPKNPTALLGLANVSFESGVFDRDAEYFRRYLTEKPDDTKANTDLALTLVQINETEEAIGILQRLLTTTPKLFPARMGLALAYRVAGKTDAALAEAEKALSLAPDEDGRIMISRFISETKESPTGDRIKEDPQGRSAPISPAVTINEFFRSHPILGQKLSGITFPEAGLAEVALVDFPVSAMPEFARRKFEGNVRSMLSSLSERITIRFIDAKTREKLLEITPGEGGK